MIMAVGNQLSWPATIVSCLFVWGLGFGGGHGVWHQNGASDS